MKKFSPVASSPGLATGAYSQFRVILWEAGEVWNDQM
jgi:hypothetical protein